jgi:hypothetical protein
VLKAFYSTVSGFFLVILNGIKALGRYSAMH